MEGDVRRVPSTFAGLVHLRALAIVLVPLTPETTRRIDPDRKDRLRVRYGFPGRLFLSRGTNADREGCLG